MKIVFQKSKLPLLKRFEEHAESARDCWTLARAMRSEDGFCAQDASVFLLLQEGAMRGDPYSACELGRYLFETREDAFLPLALSWWHKAVRQRDEGALWDVSNRPIFDRILQYSVKGGYADIEMKCVMLTDFVLLRSGRDVWNELPFAEKEARIRALANASANQLLLPETPPLRLEPNYRSGGVLVDGTATRDGTLVIRKEVADDFDRLVQVLFHELGHYAEYAAERDPAVRARLGLDEDRVASWARGDMGLEVSAFEEDADTLSYGVFSHYVVLFG